MDKQLEQRIRDRAYELWMRDGCQPDRSEEYWLQAEQEIVGDTGALPAEVTSAPFLSQGDEAPVVVSSAPLGMTSQTDDEVLPSAEAQPADAPKTRRRRGAAVTTGESTDAAPASVTPAAAPKRKRTARTT